MAEEIGSRVFPGGSVRWDGKGGKVFRRIRDRRVSRGVRGDGGIRGDRGVREGVGDDVGGVGVGGVGGGVGVGGVGGNITETETVITRDLAVWWVGVKAVITGVTADARRATTIIATDGVTFLMRVVKVVIGGVTVIAGG